MGKIDRKIIIILTIGVILSLAVWMKEHRMGAGQTEELIRNPAGEGEKRVNLIAESDFGKEEIRFEIEELEGADVEDEEEEGFLFEREEKTLSKEEQFREDLLAALMRAEEDSRDQEAFILPESVGDVAVTWRTKQKKKAPMIAGITLLLAAVVYFLPRMADDKKAKERKERMKKEFPNFAFRISMLLSAGLTTRQVWERLLTFYERSSSRDVLYEEIKITYQEIRNGISEYKAYENLSRRCENREMTRLCGLLCQGIRRGSKELSIRIREEGRNSLKVLSDELRRENETIGTKLLLPTMVLLLIVMVIVMLPAFSMI